MVLFHHSKNIDIPPRLSVVMNIFLWIEYAIFRWFWRGKDQFFVPIYRQTISRQVYLNCRDWFQREAGGNTHIFFYSTIVVLLWYYCSTIVLLYHFIVHVQLLQSLPVWPVSQFLLWRQYIVHVAAWFRMRHRLVYM